MKDAYSFDLTPRALRRAIGRCTKSDPHLAAGFALRRSKRTRETSAAAFHEFQVIADTGGCAR